MARRQPESGELTLIPIMNLVTLLIPFLLMSAQFVSYAMIESTLPAICDGPSCGGAAPDDVALRIRVAADSYRIATDSSGLADLDAGVVVPCPAGDCARAVPDLRERLTVLKDAHPALVDVVLVPDPDVTYESVVLAMDATREDPFGAGVPGEPCDGRCLFPRVTVAGGPESL